MDLKKLEIGYEFIEAFGRDVDYNGLCEQSTYLDIETGKMIWIYEENEDAEFTYGIPQEEKLHSNDIRTSRGGCLPLRRNRSG